MTRVRSAFSPLNCAIPVQDTPCGLATNGILQTCLLSDTRSCNIVHITGERKGRWGREMGRRRRGVRWEIRRGEEGGKEDFIWNLH